MFKRRRFKQQTTLEDRLSAWARSVREQAAQLPPGLQRDAMLKRASQAETASHMNEWLHSPGLQPPD